MVNYTQVRPINFNKDGEAIPQIFEQSPRDHTHLHSLTYLAEQLSTPTHLLALPTIQFQVPAAIGIHHRGLAILEEFHKVQPQ